MSKNKKLYNDMREAIERNDHQSMSKIIRDRDYQPNNPGEGEERMTALHTATLKEDPEALSILLHLEKIDPNAKLSNGFTPLLLAAARGRMLSFEILIGDQRVDVAATDNEGQTATDLVKAHGKLIVAKRAKELLARRSSISQAVLTSTKTPEVNKHFHNTNLFSGGLCRCRGIVDQGGDAGVEDAKCRLRQAALH